MNTVRPPGNGDAKPTLALVGLLVSWLLGGVLFVVLWAGMNFTFGTALDGPIGAFIMEEPCQRLARTTEPLSRYSLGQGKGRLSSSRCHFASGSIVVDGPTEGLGFTRREFAYLVLGLVGYAVCFAGALAGTVVLVRGGWRLVAGLVRRAGRHERDEA